MDFKEIKKKSQTELHKMLAESRDKLRELKFKDANKQLKDVRSIRKLRAIIAQTLTVINQQRSEGSKKTTTTAKLLINKNFVICQKKRKS